MKIYKSFSAIFQRIISQLTQQKSQNLIEMHVP